jgi:hypothetical protein
MLIPNRRMPRVHHHAPDLAQSQSMPSALPARVGVAVEVRLRLSDNSSWRLEPFLDFSLSVLKSHGCSCGRTRSLGNVYFIFYWFL